MSKIQIFVSFDVEHDEELYELLLEQSRGPTSNFTVVGGSESTTAAAPPSEKIRRQIRSADEVIVICGEHTEGSMSVSAELRNAQEEQVPYFLLWGRRELMCTKPVGAKPAEGMYSWTRQILEDQIVQALRKSVAEAAAEKAREAHRKR